MAERCAVGRSPGSRSPRNPGRGSTSASMARRWCHTEFPPRPSTNGHAQRAEVEGGTVSPDVGELGHEGRAVGLTIGACLIAQPVPARVAHHATEESLGEGGRVLVGDARRATPGPPLAPRQRWLVRADRADRPRGLDCRPECDVAAVGVAHHHGRPAHRPTQRDRRRAPRGSGPVAWRASGGSRAGRRSRRAGRSSRRTVRANDAPRSSDPWTRTTVGAGGDAASPRCSTTCRPSGRTLTVGGAAEDPGSITRRPGRGPECAASIEREG